MAQPNSQIDPRLVKWDDAPTINPNLVKWDEAPSIADRAGRVAGLGARAVTTGVMGLPLLVGEGANQAYNLATGSNRPSVFEGWNTFLNNAGLPEPQTGVERFSTAVTGGMSGVGGQLGAVRNAAGPIRDALMQVPARQIVAGGTAGAASQTAAEAGAGPVGQTVAGVAGGLAPFAPSMVRGMPSPEVARTADATRTLRNAGYRLPPTQAAGGLTNATMETYVAGKAPTDRLLSMKNQATTNRLAKEELGFNKMKPLTDANLDEYRSVVSQPYREVEKLSADAASALKELRESRRQSSLFYKSYNRSQNPEELTKAETFKARADELEGVIDGIAKTQGRAGLVDDLATARTKLAKSYAIERALNDETGNVDAAVFGRMLGNGEYLTGNLKTIGTMARIYGAAARTPEKVGAPAGRDVLSTYMSLLGAGGVGGGITSGNAPMTAAGIAAMALPAARPMARSLITSRPYQAIMVNPQTPLSRPDAATLGILSSAYQ